MRNMKYPNRIAQAAVFALYSSAAALAQNAAGVGEDEIAAAGAALPNGASSITETYSDWAVNCVVAENRKHCAFSQQQGDNQSGQRIFAVELSPGADGGVDGILILPFGLSLDHGVELKIDDQEPTRNARFSTCIRSGCLVPIAFPNEITEKLKKGSVLAVSAEQNGNGGAVAFSVSLQGFTAAMSRAEDLLK